MLRLACAPKTAAGLGSPPLLPMREQDENLSPIDAWTPVHLVIGAGARLLGMRPWHYAMAQTAYELFEQGYEAMPGNAFGAKRPESASNALVDILAGLIGYALVGRIDGAVPVGSTRPPGR